MVYADFKRMCANLRNVAIKYELGLGGENLDEVVIAELERLKGAPTGQWVKDAMPLTLVPILYENSEVDGQDWSEEWFDALDFSAENLGSDTTYTMGCLKYVPCAKDDDPTCGHRVRSRFPDAEPVKSRGKWMWLVRGLPAPTS